MKNEPTPIHFPGTDEKLSNRQRKKLRADLHNQIQIGEGVVTAAKYRFYHVTAMLAVIVSLTAYFYFHGSFKHHWEGVALCVVLVLFISGWVYLARHYVRLKRQLGGYKRYAADLKDDSP